MSDFVHLHCHTGFSLLDGAIKIKDMCKKAVASNMTATAITDHGNMYGAAAFYSACKDSKIKPIIGCEFYLAKNHLDFEDRKRFHLILLAMNNDGYKNLLKLCSVGYTDGFYYRPRIDKNLLYTHNEGIIALSACFQGEVPQALIRKDENGNYLSEARRIEAARSVALEYKKIFGDRYYFEIQKNSLDGQELINAGLIELGHELDIQVVATNDCHYLNKEDAKAHDVLLCIQTGKAVNDEDRLKFDTDSLYYKTPEEMYEDFSDNREAVALSAEIASRCNVQIEMGKHYFPVYELPENSSIEEEFKKLSILGLQKRFEEMELSEKKQVKYKARLEYEINVILEMGFPGYFLIVQDFINWAKNHGIPVGPGRGSAAGSLVAYALRITNIDPLPWDLLFERFLNIERVSLPDIDVDFCERRRGEVIDYMGEKYGRDHVAQISTFGTLKAKNALKDVGKAFRVDFSIMNALTKSMPDKMNITEALEADPDFKALSTSKELAPVFEAAIKLENLSRHASIHAAGLVVSDKPMQEYTPVVKDKKTGGMVSQFEGKWVEKVGLVKFDFLGLKTLTIIQDTLDSIKNLGLEVPDLEKLSPFEDRLTWELLSAGGTCGVFQVEGEGLTKYMVQLKPTCFEDLVAMLALYRPGPLGSGMVDAFIRRKKGLEPVSYYGLDAALEPVLKPTYGIIVYQEQVMQIAQVLAGYTLGGADILRRAMGKKNPAEMASQREIFVSGCEKNNITTAKANEIFDLMEKFAEYGFNKSHSAAYAQISYQTAYLKAHYPVAFMAAVLTSESGNTEKLAYYMKEVKRLKIKICPPSINISLHDFTPTNDNSIVYGLDAIKGIGQEVSAIIAEREKSGPYTSLYDVFSRLGTHVFGKKTAEIIIKSGCLDSFNKPRQAMVLAINHVYSIVAKKDALKKQKQQQVSMFEIAEAKDIIKTMQSGIGIQTPFENVEEYSLHDKLRFEKNAFGSYLTGHPLEAWKTAPKQMPVKTLSEYFAAAETGAWLEPRWTFLVKFSTLDKKVAKQSQKPFAIGTIDDLTDSCKVCFFSKDFEAMKDQLSDVLLGKKEIFYLTASPKVTLDEEQNIVSIELLGRELQPAVSPLALEPLAPSATITLASPDFLPQWYKLSEIAKTRNEAIQVEIKGKTASIVLTPKDNVLSPLNLKCFNE